MTPGEEKIYGKLMQMHADMEVSKILHERHSKDISQNKENILETAKNLYGAEQEIKKDIQKIKDERNKVIGASWFGGILMSFGAWFLKH